jgi:hypothetical protein
VRARGRRLGPKNPKTELSWLGFGSAYGKVVYRAGERWLGVGMRWWGCMFEGHAREEGV